jgi:hypothetical protein
MYFCRSVGAPSRLRGVEFFSYDSQRDLTINASAELWSYVELWWTRQERTLPVCLPSFVCMIFTSRRHIGKRCPRFFLPSPFDSFACDRVQNIATYDIFLDGSLRSILSSLAHSVTIEALWWYVAVPKRLQLRLGAMYTHLHPHLTRTRSTAEASRRRITGEVRGESTTHVCSLLFARIRYKRAPMDKPA